jgi:hypothetical protein
LRKLLASCSTVLAAATVLAVFTSPSTAGAATKSASAHTKISAPSGAHAILPRGGLAVTVSGVPGGASMVIIEAEAPLTHIGVPKVIHFYTLAAVPVTGSVMAVTVPPSRRLESVAAAQHGVVNLAVIVESATRTYGRMTWARVLPAGTASVSVSAIDRTSYPRVRGGSTKSLSTSASPDACAYFQVSSTEGVTRLGELHVANLVGMAGMYGDTVTADNVVSVGSSINGNPGTFSAGGTITISNSIGSSGGFSRTTVFNQYVDGHLYYGRFQGVGTFCVYNWALMATSSVGDAFPGTRAAPGNPYGTCHADPNGHATVAPIGYWNQARSQSHTYTGIFSWFGFSFSGSNGFTNNVNEGWINRNSSTSTFICGDVNPVQDSRILWNNLS